MRLPLSILFNEIVIVAAGKDYQTPCSDTLACSAERFPVQKLTANNDALLSTTPSMCEHVYCLLSQRATMPRKITWNRGQQLPTVTHCTVLPLNVLQFSTAAPFLGWLEALARLSR